MKGPSTLKLSVRGAHLTQQSGVKGQNDGGSLPAPYLLQTTYRVYRAIRAYRAYRVFWAHRVYWAYV